MRTRITGIVCSALITVLCAATQAQNLPTLLVISQPAAGKAPDRFVDLAPHLRQPLEAIGKFRVVIYQATNQAVQNAIKDGGLKPEDIQPPLSRDAMHRIAKVHGAPLILHVTAENTKDGVTMSNELETLSGQNTWTQSFVENVGTAKSAKKKLGLLESIHIHVDHIVQRLGGGGIGLLPAGPAIEIGPDGKPIRRQNPADPAGANNRTSAAATPVDNSVNPQVVPPDAPAVERKTGNVSTYTLLIERARRTGDLAGLIVALRKAINESPRDVRLRRELANAYKDRGTIVLAKEEAVRAAALAPEDGAVRRLLGDVLRDAGDNAGAIKEYEEGVRLSPQDPLSHMALGDALMDDGRTDDAVKAFQAAIQADAKVPAPHLRLARLHVRKGAYTDALSALNAARPLVAEADTARLMADGSAMLTVIESTLVETLARLQSTSHAFKNGTKTREEAFREITALRKRADELSIFVDGMPDLGLARPQALYGQAASLTVQAADKIVEHLETQSTSAGEEANLLRIEAKKQLGEAGVRMKAILDAKPA